MRQPSGTTINVRQLRLLKGMSLSAAAAIGHVDPTALSKVERGLHGVTMQFAAAFHTLYGIDPADWTGGAAVHVDGGDPSKGRK